MYSDNIIVTKDGSSTLIHPKLQETYHSVNGAVAESLHVFIDAGLNLISNSVSPVKILEVGFGTGLNALLAYKFAQQNNITVDYTAIEPFPVDEIIIKKLSGENPFCEKELIEPFLQMHNSPEGEKIKLENNFLFQKLYIKIQDISYIQQFHLVFYDAFSPSVQPEMWKDTIFQKIYNSMYDNGVMVTYCAKGTVKRTLKEIGFLVESLPGATGKREMIRATKKQHL